MTLWCSIVSVVLLALFMLSCHAAAQWMKAVAVPRPKIAWKPQRRTQTLASQEIP